LTGRLSKFFLISIINLTVIGVIVLFGYLLWMRINHKNIFSNFEKAQIQEKSIPPTPNDTQLSIEFPPINSHNPENVQGIPRRALMMTTIPSRPRTDIITYTVETGDSLFSIAENFKIQATTLLWGNFETLEDNPHLLKPGQILNILPVDGTYYQWKENDTLESVASFFKTTSDQIIEFTGNGIDLTEISNGNPGIEVAQWIIVPGGKRAIKDWGPPAISRSNPASASTYGPGYCGQIYEGAVGTQSFLWPTGERYLSGYTYDSAVHPAIDIAGQVGNAVFASDTGVVVYSGWSNYGYGYLIVIDHGFGWQTAYAHLSAVGTSCGQSVIRGGVIGALGSTGNSSGPHLHFELVYNGVKVNPMDYLQ
jgi:hypothetical protein